MFKVTFKYINTNGFIRSGQLVIEAKDLKSATEAAAKRLEENKTWRHAKVMKIEPYML